MAPLPLTSRSIPVYATSNAGKNFGRPVATPTDKGRMDVQQVIERVELLRRRSAERDTRHAEVMAIRAGDYQSIAGDLLPEAYDRPLVANLIDTVAHDMAEVMAPLPSINCASTSMSNESAKKFAEKRARIAQGYVQNSRLSDQMFNGADRYGSFGYLAYVVEPDLADQMPVIRVEDAVHAYWVTDRRMRVREYACVYLIPSEELCYEYPDQANAIRNYRKTYNAEVELEVIRWYDDHCQRLILPSIGEELAYIDNPLKFCPVRVVQRPSLTGSPRGQFDDVIWVQIARAMTAAYTMNAVVQSVEAPIIVPTDVQELSLGALEVLRTDNPQSAGRLQLNVSPGLFPQQSQLQQEQLIGSRYPEGRSGSIDASIITGQGVQALMGTFDTQVKAFQELNSSALEDVIGFCFEMDEKLWGDTRKTIRGKDNGAPYKLDYVPSKDIDGDYTCDVTYGAIAGLDPNRGLVFLLQALGGGLVSKDTVMRHLPVSLNVSAEQQQINTENIRDSLTASVASLAQAIPMMASQGQDPREIVTQIAEVLDAIEKGKSIDAAALKVFAPKQEEQPALPPGAPAGPTAENPELPGGGESEVMQLLAGMSQGGGSANMQANVMRQQAI